MTDELWRWRYAAYTPDELRKVIDRGGDDAGIALAALKLKAIEAAVSVGVWPVERLDRARVRYFSARVK